jgi:hypothetical protein
MWQLKAHRHEPARGGTKAKWLPVASDRFALEFSINEGLMQLLEAIAYLICREHAHWACAVVRLIGAIAFYIKHRRGRG